jgi:hypothetical protein
MSARVTDFWKHNAAFSSGSGTQEMPGIFSARHSSVPDSISSAIAFPASHRANSVTICTGATGYCIQLIRITFIIAVVIFVLHYL